MSLLSQVGEEHSEILCGLICRHPVNVGGHIFQGKHVHALGYGKVQLSGKRCVPYALLFPEIFVQCSRPRDKVKDAKPGRQGTEFPGGKL